MSNKPILLSSSYKLMSWRDKNKTQTFHYYISSLQSFFLAVSPVVLVVSLTFVQKETQEEVLDLFV